MRDAQFLEDLRARVNAGEKLEYLFFWGHQRAKDGMTASCFSQWYGAPFVVDDQRYPTAEHFMMAEKAALFGDHQTRMQVLQADSPGAAKALGRKVRGFDEATWVDNRFAIVVRANMTKFAQNSALRSCRYATPCDRAAYQGEHAHEPPAPAIPFKANRRQKS